MNKERQVSLLREMVEKYGVPSDKIDISAEVDEKLNYSENKQHILSLILPLMEQAKKDEFLSQYANVEGAEALEREREIKHADEEFNKRIEKIVAESNPKLDKYYKLLDDYVEMVARGYSNSLIVSGNFGIGKSHRIIEQLGKLGADFCHFSGAITPLELYQLLYDHNGKIIFLDDIGSSIFENNKAIEIFKPALQEVAGKRFLNYATSSTQLTAPKRFEFTGKVIIAANELPTHTLSLKALMSRPLVLELFFTHKELIMLFYEIAKQKYKKTTFEQRKKVVDYIRNNIDESCDNLSIRTLLKGFEMISFNEKEWETLFKPMIKVNEKIAFLIKNETKPKEEQIELWKEELGLSERTYYMYLRKLKKRRGLCS